MQLPPSTLPYLILTVITVITFANGWTDQAVMDDLAVIPTDLFKGLRLGDIGEYFTQDLWSSIGLNTGLYRPLLMVSIALDTSVFGAWLAGYHFVNIALHLLATSLVFVLTRDLLKIGGTASDLSARLALLAAVVFCVHPIHTEVVNSIFNRSEMLATIGTVGGLCWFLRHQESQILKAWLGLGLIYFAVLLCRESAAALPGLVVVLIYLTHTGSWLQRLRDCAPAILLLLPLGVFLLMRAFALDGVVPFENIFSSPTEVRSTLIDDSTEAPDSAATESGTRDNAQADARAVSTLKFTAPDIKHISKIWFDALGLTVWPHPLTIYHNRSDTNAVLALGIQLALLGLALYWYAHGTAGPLIGLLLFYIALLPSSQIVGGDGSSANLYERFLYLPSVGLTILLAFALGGLVKRSNIRAAVIMVALYAFILTPLTWARNADWASNVKLFESIVRLPDPKSRAITALVDAHLREGQQGKANAVCQAHQDKVIQTDNLELKCAYVLIGLGKLEQAEAAFIRLTEESGKRTAAHFELGQIYAMTGQNEKARNQFEHSIATETSDFYKAYKRGYMLIRLYPKSPPKLREARVHLRKVLALNPQSELVRRQLSSLNRALGPE